MLVLLVVSSLLSMSSMGGYGRGVKEGSKRGPYAKTEDRRKAKEVRESVKAADDAGKRRLEEAAEEAKAAAKRRRQEDGVALVSDGLRDRGHTLCYVNPRRELGKALFEPPSPSDIGESTLTSETTHSPFHIQSRKGAWFAPRRTRRHHTPA